MKKLAYWIPSVIIATVIFLFSSRQRISVSDEYVYNFVFFKSLHILEYGVFCFFNYRAVLNTVTASKKRAGVISLILTIVYAVSDEYHQTFVPSREGKLRDVGFDTIGALLTVIFIWNLLPKMPKKLIDWATKLEVISKN